MRMKEDSPMKLCLVIEADNYCVFPVLNCEFSLAVSIPRRSRGLAPLTTGQIVRHTDPTLAGLVEIQVNTSL